jgi:tyrosyl-tRNA synthetase
MKHMFGKKEIDTDPEKVARVLTRGVAEIIEREHVEKQLVSGKQLRVKLGIDPTAPDLHLGHSVVLRKLRQFQDLGHQAVLIIGDFTAQIGDPTGRSVERKRLSPEEVKKNVKTYLAQAGLILNLKTLEIRHNSEWLEKNALATILKITAAGSIQQMLHRADFKKRLEDGHDVTLLETMYPLFQGYDSVMVKADIEMGGTDQKFNLLAGRRVQRYFDVPEQDVLMVPLLEGTDGIDKMSKSKGNYIGITESATKMFGKLMAVKDELLPKYFELCTNLTSEEVAALPAHPKDKKMCLAREIVTLYHGSAGSPQVGKAVAEEAQAAWEAQFSRGELPAQIPEIPITVHAMNILNLLFVTQLAASKSEGRRLVEQGGVRIGEVKKTDPAETIAIDDGMIIQVGPRKFVRVLRR